MKAKKGGRLPLTTTDAMTIITRAVVALRAASSKRVPTQTTRGEASTEATHLMTTGRSLRAKQAGREAPAAGVGRIVESTIDSSQPVRAASTVVGQRWMTAEALKTRRATSHLNRDHPIGTRMLAAAKETPPLTAEISIGAAIETRIEEVIVIEEIAIEQRARVTTTLLKEVAASTLAKMTTETVIVIATEIAKIVNEEPSDTPNQLSSPFLDVVLFQNKLSHGSIKTNFQLQLTKNYLANQHQSNIQA